MLRTRRPLLALLLLGVLLAGGYLLSAVSADPGPEDQRGPTASGPTASGPTASGPTGAGPGGPGRTASGSTGRAAAPSASARPGRGASGLPTVRAAELPAEARRTLQLIDRGGPFPYGRDGAVFGNVERLLPAHPRGWYREYTVPTPGESDRGARRLVVGRDGTRYYTADHYASFAVVEADP